MSLFEALSIGVVCYLALALALFQSRVPGLTEEFAPLRGKKYIAEAQIYTTVGSISIYFLFPFVPFQIAVFSMATIVTTLHLICWFFFPMLHKDMRGDKSEGRH